MPHHTATRRPGARLPVGVVVLSFLMLLGVAPATATPAEAEGDPSTGVGITPARVEVDLDQRAHNFDITVFNDTERPRTITMALLELGHDLNGSPLLGDPLPQLELVDGSSSFTLAPGESTELGLRAEFPSSVALYGAVVAQIEPEATDRAVSARTQVASIVLLRGPRPWDQTLEQREVGVLEAPNGTRTVYVDVANVGDAHVRASGTMRVRRDGEVLAEVRLPGEAIIPGYARRLTAPLEGDGLDGEVEIDVDLGDGAGAVTTVDLDDLQPDEAAGGDGTESGQGAATLELSDQDSDTDALVEGQRRVLLPLAALLVLMALGGLWLLTMWKRGDDDEDEDHMVATSASGGDGA